jgi:hypothetical protein
VQGGLRGAEPDLAPVEAQHLVPAARLIDVVRGDHHGPALGGEVAEQRLEPVGARRVEPREGLVEQDDPRVLHERPRHQHALALAAGEVAEGGVRLLGQAHRRQRLARGAALRAPRAMPPGQRRYGAHERHVERADREVQARALGLRDDGEAPRGAQRPRHRRQLAEQHAEERRLAAAVGAEHAQALAGAQRERDAREHRRRTVAGREPVGLHEDQIPVIGHPRAPAVKPRTIASALARSMLR